MADPTKLLIANTDMIQIILDPPCVSPPLVAPIPLVATGYSKVNEQKVCVEGDEYPPVIANSTPVPYMCPPYVIPGTGTVKITLADANKTSISKDLDKKMLRKGTTFQVELDVQVPAMMPAPPGPPQPDPMPKHTGNAMFITTNTLIVSD
jgi:hypothetical protein